MMQFLARDIGEAEMICNLPACKLNRVEHDAHLSRHQHRRKLPFSYSQTDLGLMDFYPVPVRRDKGRIFEWRSKFGRRTRRAYPAEDRKLAPEAHQTTVDAFFAELTSRLDPPQYSYTSLHLFLKQANEKDLQKPSAITASALDLVLLDDRRDNIGWLGTDGEAYSARDWDGYISYPPEGENPLTLLLDAQGLYKRLSESVSSRAQSSEIVPLISAEGS